MEIMINVELIKKLRKQKSWSQDQLATVADLSLRTVQRIEREGKASLESSRALAAVFEIDINDIKISAEEIAVAKEAKKGRKYGFIGVFLGMLFAYAGITYSFLSNEITGFEAGVYCGVIGALCGFCCMMIGMRTNKIIGDRTDI